MNPTPNVWPSNMLQLPTDVRLAAQRSGVATANDAEASRARDGGRQTAARHEGHRRADDRVPDAERFGEPGAKLFLALMLPSHGADITTGSLARIWQYSNGAPVQPHEPSVGKVVPAKGRR